MRGLGQNGAESLVLGTKPLLALAISMESVESSFTLDLLGYEIKRASHFRRCNPGRLLVFKLTSPDTLLCDSVRLGAQSQRFTCYTPWLPAPEFFRMRTSEHITRMGFMIPDLGRVTQPTRVWNVALGKLKLYPPGHFSGRGRTDKAFHTRRLRQLADTTQRNRWESVPNTFFERSMVFDLLQVNQHSLWVDLAITFRSVPCIVKLACLASGVA